MTRWVALLAIASSLLAIACEREVRPFQTLASASARTQKATLSPIYPGSPPPPGPELSPFQHNAYGMSEGKRLFDAYNCSGCHAHGGGGMGPALMDDKWIYGSKPDQIYATISQGRPDGMPSFGGHIPTQQIWQLVAYVQSMSRRWRIRNVFS